MPGEKVVDLGGRFQASAVCRPWILVDGSCFAQFSAKLIPCWSNSSDGTKLRRLLFSALFHTPARQQKISLRCATFAAEVTMNLGVSYWSTDTQDMVEIMVAIPFLGPNDFTRKPCRCWCFFRSMDGLYRYTHHIPMRSPYICWSNPLISPL